jgi:molybdate-binding protein/DNA-binding XRE family transcriptional regulator
VSYLHAFRIKQSWTQAELAQRSGVPRSSIAAIESRALVPSVNTALALARALDCSVEELFGGAGNTACSWAWQPARHTSAYWEAMHDQRVLTYPIEPIPYSILPPDGWFDDHSRISTRNHSPALTLIMASCDPAAGLLAAMMNAMTSVRVISFHRSSNEALSLLEEGVIHVAGMHLREMDEPEGNADVVRATMGEGFRLIRGAVWHDGVAVRPGEGLNSLRKLRSPGIRWIGRREGTGARRCQDKIFENRKNPKRNALNHDEVAMAVRMGWVDAGVCHRLTTEQAGLEFFHMSNEVFDWCYALSLENDPRIEALRKIVKSSNYRKALARFAGIEAHTTGEETLV